jgi:hypothetical protein
VNRDVLCVDNRSNPAALEVRKVYTLLEDAAARARGLLGVIDESGEDYIYPQHFFVRITVPRGAVRVFAKKVRPRRRRAVPRGTARAR